MRKKILLASVVTAIAFTAVLYAATLTASQAEKGMIIGEVIDITGYAMFGRLGEENREAGLYRAEHGFPIGVLEEETGTVWNAVYRLPVPAAGLQTANKILSPFMGQKVVVQGSLFRAKGVSLVRVSLVSEY